MKDKIKLLLFTILAICISVSILSMLKVKHDIKLYFITGIIVTSIIFLYVISVRIHEKYLEDDPVLVELREELRTCFPEIDNTVILRGRKSYTINKKTMHICMVDKDGKYYDKNMLKYVIIHELAHVLCEEIGHTPLFHKIFEELLRKAIKCKVYDDKIPTIKNYCEY